VDPDRHAELTRGGAVGLRDLHRRHVRPLDREAEGEQPVVALELAAVELAGVRPRILVLGLALELVQLARHRGAVEEARADADLAQGAHVLLGVLGRIDDVAPVEHRGDAGGQRVRGARQHRRVDVLGAVTRRDLRPLARDQVPEDVIHRVRARAGLPEVTMRVDQSGHDDHLRGVEHLGVFRRDLWRDLDDRVVLDEHVPLAQFADRGVDAHDRAALDQKPVCHLVSSVSEVVSISDRAAPGRARRCRRPQG
jgi:hypothetical protein